jgi:chitodextrinase
LNWGADTNATEGYRVTWYSNSAGTSVLSNEDIAYSAGTMNSTKVGLTASTQYWYKVSPINPDGIFGDPNIISGCSIHTVTTTA